MFPVTMRYLAFQGFAPVEVFLDGLVGQYMCLVWQVVYYNVGSPAIGNSAPTFDVCNVRSGVWFWNDVKFSVSQLRSDIRVDLSSTGRM
ncbi:hypothetical protein AMTR_s00096p00169300 [Amborella trichopoda]|uniref:Uncharacterized protein n=1 Tax=Amborella trichopoda TaxID=13333 RepID=W1P4D3_AMBTC|nr:hypothetical protein AMTR_s00096p00169300 [Amborella trichopoda]